MSTSNFDYEYDIIINMKPYKYQKFGVSFETTHFDGESKSTSCLLLNMSTMSTLSMSGISMILK